MKNNISFYPHFTNSHEHWKFELLRAKYDWQGEGIFWALNNMIGLSENTVLDVNNKSKRASIASKFKMTLESFEEYLQYLSKDCELIIYKEGLITTDIVTNTFSNVAEKRNRERVRMDSWRKQKQCNADVTRDNGNVRSIKESKEKKSKVNYIKDLKMSDCKLKPETIDYKVIEYSIKLFDGFKATFPDNKDLDWMEIKDWIPPVRELVQKKNYTYDQIAKVMNWACEDKFWKTTIINTASLEKNFEQLKLKYQNG